MKSWLQQFWNWLYFGKGASPYASFERRMLANMIDTLLVLVIIMPLIKPFMKVADPAMQQIQGLTIQMQQGVISSQEYNITVMKYLAGEGGKLLLIDFSYQMIFMGGVIVLFWFYRNATPGKMLLNIEIVDAQTGDKPTRKQYIIRYIGYIVAGVPFMIGFLWILFNKKRQGWHDKMAGTLVVLKPKKEQV